MLLEGANILIQRKHSLHRDLNLIFVQMGESIFQKICHKFLKQKNRSLQKQATAILTKIQ